VADTPDEAIDVVAVGGQVRELAAPRIATANNHGSGCSFASAIAAGLARGAAPLDAVTAAKAFVHAAVRAGAGWRLGAGHGPLDHFAGIERQEDR
jgi:hydroxymethylpyrimidine/phosphomethylpyrimidine kinase